MRGSLEDGLDAVGVCAEAQGKMSGAIGSELLRAEDGRVFAVWGGGVAEDDRAGVDGCAARGDVRGERDRCSLGDGGG